MKVLGKSIFLFLAIVPITFADTDAQDPNPGICEGQSRDNPASISGDRIYRLHEDRLHRLRPLHLKYQLAEDQNTFLRLYARTLTAACRFRAYYTKNITNGTDFLSGRTEPSSIEAVCRNSESVYLKDLKIAEKASGDDFDTFSAGIKDLEENYPKLKQQNSARLTLRTPPVDPGLQGEFRQIWDGDFQEKIKQLKQEREFIVIRHVKLANAKLKQEEILSKCGSLPGTAPLLAGSQQNSGDIGGVLAVGAVAAGGVFVVSQLGKDHDDHRPGFPHPSPSPTNTYTGTGSWTNTNTWTNTTVSTNTSTGTSTATVTNTGTGTGVSTNTSTNTNTSTAYPPPAGSYLTLSPQGPNSAKAWLNLSSMTVTITVPGGGIFPTNNLIVQASCVQPSPCSLSGTTSVRAENGLAVFNNIRFTSAQSDVVLSFSAPGVSSVSSTTFSVAQ